MNGLAKHRRISRPTYNPDTESFCTKCREVKPREAFPKNKNSGNGLHAWCLECNNGHCKEWESVPENYRRRRDQQARNQRRYHAAARGTPLAEGPVKAKYALPPALRTAQA